MKGVIKAIINITLKYSESVKEDVKELYYTYKLGKNILIYLTTISVSFITIIRLIFVMDTSVYSTQA